MNRKHIERWSPFLLLLDGVTDPHNLGACLRSADAAGVHAVISPRDKSASMLATTGVKIQDMFESLRGMSGGQRQCVAIARAAGFAKKLIILDEPTAALGVQETARVEEIIKGLKKQGIPLIIISHNLRQVFDLVDRIWVFRQGRIICSCLTRETSPEQIVGLITGAIDPASLRSADVNEAATC